MIFIMVVFMVACSLKIEHTCKEVSDETSQLQVHCL